MQEQVDGPAHTAAGGRPSQYYPFLAALSLRATGSLARPAPYCEVEQIAVALINTATAEVVDEIAVDVIPDYRDLPTLGWDELGDEVGQQPPSAAGSPAEPTAPAPPPGAAAAAAGPTAAASPTGSVPAGGGADPRSGAPAPAAAPAAAAPAGDGRGGLPLTEAVGVIDLFFGEHGLQLGQFMFVCASRWHLNSCLKIEAACKRVALRQHWAYYIDVRIEALKRGLEWDGAPATELVPMLRRLGLDPHGADTPGAPQCTAVARAVQALLAAGHLFMSPQVVGEATVSQMERQWKTMQGCESDDPVMQAVREQQVVNVKGVPDKVSVAYIQGFFAPLEVVHSNVCISSTEGGDYQVHVRFLQPSDWTAALRHFSRSLGGQLIDVLPSTVASMEASARASRPVQWDPALFVRCANLPPDSTYQYLQSVFAPAELSPGGTFFITPDAPDGTRCAFVQFLDAGAAAQALAGSAALPDSVAVEPCSAEALDMAFMSGALLPAVPASSQAAALGDGMEQHEAAEFGRSAVPPPPSREISQHVVRLRGLPYAASEFDVAQFLDGVRICVRGIHLLFTSQDRPLGEAFVELCSAADVETALGRHRLSIGHRYVEVFKSNPSEVLWVFEHASKLTPPLCEQPELVQYLPVLYPLPVDYPYRHKFQYLLSDEHVY
eukprot:TRINITY_DN20974_c0_g1_i1.p1 TRINITY_DN20974_c0_g1~~TRINITY_DN20974_c0_g1_i1.p1  ORF type:complete len:665 (+),score=181.38 TRINITY_DN20974_c0_g1_i1:68-2062(+)